MGKMLDLFNEIWEERPHVSEASKKPLLPKSHPQWHWQFCHVLGKNVAPRYKYKKENIMLLLPEEHEIQERLVPFMQRKEKLKEQYFKERKIK